MGLTVPPGASGVDLIKIGSIFQAPQWQQDLFVRGTGRQLRHRAIYFRDTRSWDKRMRPAPKLGIQAWLGHPYAPKQHRSIYRHPDRFWADF